MKLWGCVCKNVLCGLCSSSSSSFFFICRFSSRAGDILVIVIDILAINCFIVNTSKTDISLAWLRPRFTSVKEIAAGACVFFFFSRISQKFVKHCVQKIHRLHVIKCIICQTAGYVTCLCWVFKRDLRGRYSSVITSWYMDISTRFLERLRGIHWHLQPTAFLASC